MTMTKAGKQPSASPLKRRFRLLDRLPVYDGSNEGMTVRELTSYLCANGCQCDERTVYRDLEELDNDADGWGIGLRLRRATGSARAGTRWSHASDSKAQLLKTLSRDDALLLSLMAQELHQFMPASANSTLAKFLQASERVLSLPGNQRARDFRERIRSVPAGPMSIPPPVNIAFLHEINEALLGEEQIDMLYRPLKVDSAKPYRLHPIGLVKQGLFLYLVAVKDELALGARPTIQSFRVDRIDTVARRAKESVARGLPTLSSAIEGGTLQFFQEGMIELVVQFAKSEAGNAARKSLEEAPFSLDQCIHTLGDGNVELRATVRDSLQLLTYLQGKADALQVVAPPALCAKVAQWVRDAGALYGGVDI